MSETSTPRWLRWLLAVACAAAVAATGLRAQEVAAQPPGPLPTADDPDYVNLTAPDGSRFLLVPTGGPPVVHWVMVTPAGPAEEPPGLEGLSYAVARAAMAGTSYRRTTEPEAELRALTVQDRYEQAWAELTAAGKPITDQQLQELEQARSEAASLVERMGWERDLLSSPAVAVRLDERPDAVLLELTTTVAGLLPAARLLVERREGQVLRGLYREFREVRAELAPLRTLDPQGTMRREVLGLSFPGHPLARAWARTDATVPLLRQQAVDVYRQTQHPKRTLHVLTGGFDIGEVSQLIVRVFVRTAITAPPVAVLPPRVASSFERSTVIPGKAPAVTIGYVLPEDIDREMLPVLVQWLGGGDDSALMNQLRERGHAQATVACTAPFPGESGGLLLLECRDPSGEDAASGRRFVENVEDSLVELLAGEPAAESVDRVVSALRASAAIERQGPERLAARIAIRCGIAGTPSDRLFAPPADVTPAGLHAFMRHVLAPDRRAVVSVEVKP